MDENENDVWTFSDVLNDVIIDCEAAASKAKPGSEEHVVITKELISLCETKARCLEADIKFDSEQSKLELDRKSLALKERELDIKFDSEQSKLELDRKSLALKERELDLKEREIASAEKNDKDSNIYRWVDRGLRALGTAGFLGTTLMVIKAECEDNHYMKTSAWRLVSSGISKGLLRPPM